MIQRLTARPILDSRGEWTIEVVAWWGDRRGIASVPQGESRGAREAVSLPADQAVKNILEIIAPALEGNDFPDQARLDQRLQELDGTATKERLGGNALLGVSLAYARLTASMRNQPLWQYLRDICAWSVKPIAPPQLLSLMIEGGLHAPGGALFQEYLVLPQTRTIVDAIDLVTDLYGSLRELVSRRFGPAATRLGDEGAFAPPTTYEPFALIIEAGQASGLADKFDVGLDAAATGLSLAPEELIALYRELRASYPLRYLEDPFNENDLDHFASCLAEFGEGIMITGDDLTVTNVKRMELAQTKRSVNAMIVKPNQIGTVTQTLAAVRLAREYGWQVIVSHRGRETNDDFIADLAWGIGADGIKLGAPARGERVAKYNRLLELEAMSGI
ncbi:MAG: phosphopyruvate hydratase [Patescibacteria group bacterium]